MFKSIASVTLLLVFAVPSHSAAGMSSHVKLVDPDSLLFGRSSLILNLAFASGASVSTSVGIGTVETETSGFGGSFSYQNWFTPDLAATFSAGGLVYEIRDVVGPSGVYTETATTSPLLFGLRHHPSQLRMGETMFPFIAVGAGPYFGVQTRSGVRWSVGTETVVEMAFGVNGSAGFDWYAWRHFNISAGFGYHAITSYGKDIGSSDNHSGPEFTLAFGWVF